MKESTTIDGEDIQFRICDKCGQEVKNDEYASLYLPTAWVEVEPPASQVRRDLDLCRDCLQELFSLIQL